MAKFQDENLIFRSGQIIKHGNRTIVDGSGNFKPISIELNSNSVTITEFSTDDTLSGDSDSTVPTEKAIKTYVDNVTSTSGTSGTSGSSGSSGFMNLTSDLDDQVGSGEIVYNEFYVATNATGKGTPLYMETDGYLYEMGADSSNVCVALALTDSTGLTDILLAGFYRDSSWSWTPGLPLYIGETVGTFTQTPPGSGFNAQIVGFAKTSDTIRFKPSYIVGEVI